MNGSLDNVDGRCVLRFERRLAHPPAKVWRAITDPEELAGWFPTEIQGERKQGALIRFGSGEDDEGPQEGEITEFDPPRLFAFTWGASVLRWQLHPDGSGCRLIFTQTFDDRPFAASYATGWQLCLEALDRVLAGRSEPAAPASETAATRIYRARHEAYAEVFGLLAGTVDAADASAQGAGDGWTVRFARLLPYPADEVWSVLTGGARPAPGGRAPAQAASEQAPPGPVTEAQPEAVLAYDSAGGAVRWALTPGPGGTLLELSHRTTHPVEALAGWHAHLEDLAASMSGRIGGTPAAALRARYAELVGS